MSECPLDDKQLQTILWIADGKTYEEIVAIQAISKQSIQRRVWKAYDATGTHNLPGLIALAFRKGWLS